MGIDRLLAIWRRVFAASAVLAAVAGLMLFAGAAETDRFFSWTIEPPATAAFLGATYWAVAVLFARNALQAEVWPQIRLGAVAEAVAAVLLVTATLLHLDKFHHDLFGYFWIVVYAAAAPLLLALLVVTIREAQRFVERFEPWTPVPAGLRRLIAAQSAAFGAFGVALFLAPDTASDLWPWDLTPLTARAIAAFLIGLAAAGAIAARERELRWIRDAGWTYLALGVLQILAAAIHAGDFHSDAALLAFIGFWATVAGAGAWGLGAPLSRG
jgi:hypothetical protein